MSDPRNAAHDKKVSQEKKHHPAEQAEPAAAPEQAEASESPVTAAGASPEAVARHDASVAVLTQLKDMEFHSRANLERLAEMMLTVEDTLKQKEFVEPLGEIFSHQDAFQTKLTALIEVYKATCDQMPG
jgi:hypothetical protein